jgi:protein Mpv17
MAFNILSCPPNYLWQTWLESAFPGYTEKPTPREEEKSMDEKVRSTSTATDADSLRSRSRNEDRTTPISYSPPSDKKQLSVRNTATKFLLDQTFGAAFNTITFLMGIPMLRGQSWQNGWEEVKTGFWPLVFAGQKLWPLVSLISLTLVPVERRMVFGSIIGVGWGIFLSLMAGGQKDKTE